MKRIVLILSAVMLSLATSCTEKGTDVRLLYWNIQNGMWDGQPDNYDRFVDYVKSEDPDICVWCEGRTIYVSNSTEHIPYEERYLVDHWDELAARYGHNYSYVGGFRDSYPQVITSKYPIENVERIIGNGQDSVVSHGCGWATVEVAGRRLNIVTLHTWPQRYALGAEDQKASAADHGGDKYRRMEIEYICKHTIETVPEAADQYWMMLGDHNALSIRDNFFYNFPGDSICFLAHNYILENTPYLDVLSEIHPGEFLTTTHSQSRIDFVYFTPALMETVVDAKVCRNDYLEPVRDPQNLSNFYHPSDHRPILVDFKF